MLEIKVLTDRETVEKLCRDCGILDAARQNVLAATDKGEIIAYTVFSMDEENLWLSHIVPPDDIMMADGMVRSTMHVAVTRGIDKIFYKETVNEEMLSKLGLIKSKEEKTLDSEALFRDKCCGK